MQMAHDLLLANARVVLADRVIEAGWIAAMNGLIVEIGEGRAPAHAEDLGGDLLLPGLVELHTDHLEAHYVPRPKVYWDPVAAVVSYGDLRHHDDARFAARLARRRSARGRWASGDPR
jgi:alpha-D-ribose 1-methylphosphonate 5-triphosphate diphosphatase